MVHSIDFSFGKNTFDNQPAQLSLSSDGGFFEWLLADRSADKGGRYVCAPMAAGLHDDPSKYKGMATWRLKKLAMPRSFIAFDIDRFDDPNDFDRLREYLSKWRSLYYTTASHTSQVPRARAILILSEELSSEDAESLAKVLELEIKMALGQGLFFDQSVYRGCQPVYAPLIGCHHWISDGETVDVSSYKHLMAGNKSIATFGHAGGRSVGQTVPVGTRNATLLSAVGRWRGVGLPEDEILQLASAVNKSRFEVPLDDDEVEGICSRYAHQSVATKNQSGQGLHDDGSWLSSGGRTIPTVAPPPREYVFGHTITPGTLSVLGGSGGVSKTMLAMQICAASACGETVGEIQVAEGCSLLLLGEEDDAECDRRLGGICSHFKHSTSRVENRVLCLGAAGIDIRLTQKIEANSHPTVLGEEIIAAALSHADNCGVPLRFIVIDHARLVLGGDPNNAEDVTQLTRVLTNIARTTGASVLLIAHSPKSVLSKAGNEINAADIAGSSAFVDNGRTAFMAYGMREDEAKRHYVPETERHNWVRVQNVKANYAQSGLGWWFKRVIVPGWDIAVLEQEGLASTEMFSSNRRATLQNKILNQIRRNPGSSKRALRDRAGRKRIFGVSERELMAEIEAMLEIGLLDARAPTSEERRNWKLSGQVREVLVSNAPC